MNIRRLVGCVALGLASGPASAQGARLIESARYGQERASVAAPTIAAPAIAT